MSAALETPASAADKRDKQASGFDAGDGRRKAAIALIMLGNDLAEEILRALDDAEVEALLKTAAELKRVEPQEAEATLTEFVSFFDGNHLLMPPADEFVRSAAEQAIGIDRVASLLGEGPDEDDATEEETAYLLAEALDAGAEAIAGVLQKEHPQTVSVALAVVPPAKGAEILGFLPEEMRPEVLRRVAQIKSVTPSLLREIGETLRRELDSSAGDALVLDGQNLAVGLLKQVDGNQEEEILNSLSEMDSNLAEAIRKKMFIFEDLLGLDPRALQMMLKEIDGRTLTLSLKTASTALREHLLSSMSSRAATMILEDLEAMGPVAVSQVEETQDEIVQVALRLAAEGKIQLR